MNDHDEIDRLNRLIAARSIETFSWLQEQGIEFHSPEASGFIKTTESDGRDVAFPLIERAEEVGVDVFTETKGENIIKENNEVVGVEAINTNNNKKKLKADSIIIATGDFVANENKIARHNPEYSELPVGSIYSSTGDGLTLATDIGAATTKMDEIILTPTLESKSYINITSLLRTSLGNSIIINHDGERFTDESQECQALSNEILSEMETNNSDYMYMIFDQNTIDNIPYAEKYIPHAFEAETIEGLSDKLRVDKDILKTSINEADEGRKDLVEQPLSKLEEPPYYALNIRPGILATKGGLKVNDRSQVLDKDNNPINNLYAAGDVINCKFDSGYQLGTLLTQSFVTSRTAGIESAINSLND